MTAAFPEHYKLVTKAYPHGPVANTLAAKAVLQQDCHRATE
jgi:hypothetical protein